MNKGKKNIIIIIILLLAITSIIAVFLSLKNNDTPNNPSNNDSSTNLTYLEEENTYFGLQNILNNYYELITNGNNKELFNVLEDNYKLTNNITLENVLSKLSNNYEIVEYFPEDVLTITRNGITYYFINGCLGNFPLMDDLTFEDNVNYLVIVQDEKYVIKPLENNINLTEYAQNYNFSNIDIKNNMQFSKVSISEENKLIMYINRFLKLLYLDTDKVYEMLDDSTKDRYGSIDNFRNSIDEISENITATVFAYNKTNNVYKIIDNNQNDIIITEERVMNYKIGFSY